MVLRWEARPRSVFIVRSSQPQNVLIFIFTMLRRTRRAVGFAFYEFLQRLGFGFLHPLKPVPRRAMVSELW